MELLLDPHIWIGLFTLIILEIVLGICSPPRKMKNVFAKNENPPQR
ncbi:hypothetical protein J4G65_11335 [Aeromonas allosaccharophila]|nr:hypothetical protein [Aeromonas allosaccharophila]MBS4696061.1 hypothetical protein [Aeromonas allosaccharophila]